MRAKLKTQSLLFTALLATGFHASAQNDLIGPKATKDNSPYSRFGIGDLGNPRNTILRGMGGAATAYIDPFSVNNYNPASYSFLRVTSLDFAIEARSRSIFMNNVSTSSGTATISYLTIGVPMGKYAGMAFGFQPLSNVYYNAEDTLNDINGIGNAILNYNGSGSLQYAYLGLSGQYKGFSIGFNGGYAFGSIRHSTTLESIDVTKVRNSEFSKYNTVGGLYWKGGILYKAKLKKNQYINVGAAITLSQQLNVRRDAYDIGYQYINGSNGIEVIRDTVPQTMMKDVKGKMELPADYSFGLHYGKDFNWDIGADFVYTDWSKFNLMGDRSSVGQNAYRMAIGGEITPDPASKKLFSQTTYRLGAYYGKDYVRLYDTDVNFVGGTVGASIPLKRNYTQFARLNTALDIGQRGTIQNGMAREFFVKFTIGVSLNDKWFHKREFE